MNKQQIIEKAYGSVFSKVKLMIREYDGTIETFPDILNDEDFYWKTLGFTHDQIEDCYGDCEASRWRPISLKGIEDNNGWTKIESESDLPTKEDTRLFNVWMLETNSESPSRNHSWDVRTAYVHGWISHFRPVIEKLKPLY